MNEKTVSKEVKAQLKRNFFLLSKFRAGVSVDRKVWGAF